MKCLFQLSTSHLCIFVGNFRKEDGIQPRYQDKFSSSYTTHSPLSSLSSDHRPTSSYADPAVTSTTTTSGSYDPNIFHQVDKETNTNVKL